MRAKSIVLALSVAATAVIGGVAPSADAITPHSREVIADYDDGTTEVQVRATVLHSSTSGITGVSRACVTMTSATGTTTGCGPDGTVESVSATIAPDLSAATISAGLNDGSGGRFTIELTTVAYAGSARHQGWSIRRDGASEGLVTHSGGFSSGDKPWKSALASIVHTSTAPPPSATPVVLSGRVDRSFRVDPATPPVAWEANAATPIVPRLFGSQRNLDCTNASAACDRTRVVVDRVGPTTHHLRVTAQFYECRYVVIGTICEWSNTEPELFRVVAGHEVPTHANQPTFDSETQTYEFRVEPGEYVVAFQGETTTVRGGLDVVAA